MRLVMLGTGHAVVTRCYNTCFVVEDRGRHLLVDGGGGGMLLTRLRQAGLAATDMREIFVTHKHMDHLLGILWMLRVLSHAALAGRLDGAVRLFSHAEVTDLLDDMARRLLQPEEYAVIGRQIELVTVKDGEAGELLGHPVTFFDIGSTKDTQYGFAMEYAGGRRLVCLGDEPCHAEGERYARGCDWLLHEAFCLQADAARFRPYEKHHSTARDACALAARLGVKHVVLYHTEDEHLDSRRETYTAEGRDVFGGDILVPDDLEVIDLT